MTLGKHPFLCASCALFAFLAQPASAQPPCDSSNITTFTYQDLGGYTLQFQHAPSPGWQVLSTEWGFVGTGFNDFSLNPTPLVQFPAPDDYLVCLRTTKQQSLATTCVSTFCDLVTLPVDGICADLSAAFTIVPQGSDIQFTNTTTGDAADAIVTWDLGDGTISTEAEPLHTYTGPGPFEACLTVVSGPCTATACNWIYLGPADVPCETLLQPAIGVIQYERTIAVFDQSITSGMSSNITWDFGDGTGASGSPVIHTYPYDDYFEVCGNVDLWGPLTPDTCAATACTYVFTLPAAAVGSLSPAPAPRVSPVPFTDRFTVEGATPGTGAHWCLYDPMGRVRLQGGVPASGTFVVAGDDLAPGMYLLRTVSPIGNHAVRVVKGGG